MKSKLLIISFSFYPDDSPNTYRWKNIVDSWSEKGFEVYVVSAQKYGFNKFEIINGIKIYRTGQTIFQKFKTKIGKNSDNELTFNTKNQTLAKETLIRKIYNYTWKKLQWPDHAFLYYNPMLKMARDIIEKENITNLITVSWPFTDHLIGYKLKKEFEINWLAEIIDPFSFNDEINNQKIYSKLNLSVERKVLNKADLVSVMTERIREKYVSLFPEVIDKISVIHNVYVPEKINFINKKEKKTCAIFKMVFMGSLSPGVRTPDNLLRIFKKLLDSNLFGNIQLHFYGKTHSGIKAFYEYDYLLNNSIFLHGTVSKQEVRDILLEADILVNIGNSNPYQEPSKIIEYVYLGKPVINVCSITNDSSKELLDNYPLNFNIHEWDIENNEIMDKLIDFMHNNIEVERSIIDRIISPYLIQTVEKEYYNLIM